MSYPLPHFGLGEASPTDSAPQPATMFGLDGSTLLLLLLGGVVVYHLWNQQGSGRAPRGRRYDEIGNAVRQGDKLFYATYTSPDEEYQISNYVAAKNRTQAIAILKEWARDEGEPMKGATWDVDED